MEAYCVKCRNKDDDGRTRADHHEERPPGHSWHLSQECGTKMFRIGKATA